MVDVHTPKIHPHRRPEVVVETLDPGRVGNPAIAEWEAAGLDAPAMDVLRQYRLARIRQQLVERDFGGALLYDPLNIRYATDTSNMQVWCLHNAVRYLFVATEGPTVLFDFHGCGHLSADFPTVTETRPGISWFYFGAGEDERERAAQWATELADLMRAHGGGNRRLAVDKCDQLGIAALVAEGLEPHSSQSFVEEARKIKHPEEIRAMRRAIHACEAGMTAMWRSLEPGMTENQLWSILHRENIARGGEWIETRLLASGPRTNPWFQECSDRVIEAGDVVSFDTDLIGPYGYCCDISRAWVAGSNRPSNAQAVLHAVATEQIAFNMDLLKPGMGFREFAEKSYRLSDDYMPNRYSCVVHGVGLCDEYPSVAYPQDTKKGGYDGVFEPGMCVCFESYVGAVGGSEGVKLENQAFITETGIEVLDRFPMDLVPEV
ncbi:Xaa-Pro peptidase family protein [Microbaculum marinum]|uniref:Xaa-Pro peptidase family protein n=1 Tax=Microbaculum marinum TaxID=1764581 RepID=A0AAW9RHA9_9HYPH